MSEFSCPTLHTLRVEADKAGKASMGICVLAGGVGEMGEGRGMVNHVGQ